MARNVGETIARAMVDSSYSSLARMWHFLHLEEAGKTRSGVIGPSSTLAANVPRNHPTPTTTPRMARLMVSVFTGRDVHPIARLLPVSRCPATEGGVAVLLEGFRPERQYAGFRVVCDQFFDTLALRSEEHTSELQSRLHLVCRLLLEKKKTTR